VSLTEFIDFNKQVTFFTDCAFILYKSPGEITVKHSVLFFAMSVI